LDVRPKAAAFNPGWTAECEALEEFTDVREIRKSARARWRVRYMILSKTPSC
jgi:hypothetical protein